MRSRDIGTVDEEEEVKREEETEEGVGAMVLLADVEAVGGEATSVILRSENLCNEEKEGKGES
jgi:hypothetical protein